MWVPIIRTDRMLLRPFRLADAEAMYHNWASTDDVACYLSWYPHKDVDETRDVIGDWIAEYETDSPRWQWAIELSEGIIGSITLFLPDGEDIDDKCFEIGYCIGEAWWGNGYAAEAAQAIIDYAFRELDMEKVIASHDTNNPASGRVMQKCGMSYAGTESIISGEHGVSLKEHMSGVFAKYEITRSEWANQNNMAPRS